ncbi:MAG: cytochrome o ubiquinol/quinol oxidase subunit IV [Chromatiales bacterium]
MAKSSAPSARASRRLRRTYRWHGQGWPRWVSDRKIAADRVRLRERSLGMPIARMPEPSGPGPALQVLVHLRFFLHLDLTRENLLTIMFAAIFIFIMVGGSLWIMFDLHQRMSV